MSLLSEGVWVCSLPLPHLVSLSLSPAPLSVYYAHVSGSVSQTDKSKSSFFRFVGRESSSGKSATAKKWLILPHLICFCLKLRRFQGKVT